MANPIITYIKESQAELKKVTWPSRDKVIKDTMVVLGICVGMAIFFGVTDYGLVEIFRRFFNL